MTTTTLHPEVRDYLDAVRAHLADLAEDERDDLLEDLESHLLEVAAESDEPLSTRLGPPDEYAADLRASAGLAPAHTSRAWPRPTERAQRAWQRTAAHPTALRVRAFLPELRPGWWVLRAVLAVWVLAMVTSDVDAIDVPWPPLWNSRLLGFVALVAAIPASVRLGRRHLNEPRRRRGFQAAQVGLVLLTIPLFSQLNDRVYYYESVYDPGFVANDGVLRTENGDPITNFFATDADGNPIEDFRLYDQNGRPVTNVSEYEESSTMDGVVHSRVPVDADGRPIPNAFPRDTWLERYDGSTNSIQTPSTVVTATTGSPATTVAPATTAPSEPTTPPETTLPPDATATTVAS